MKSEMVKGILGTGLGVPVGSESVALEMSLVKSVMIIGILGIGFGAPTNDVSVALACPWCAWYADYLSGARLGNALGCVH